MRFWKIHTAAGLMALIKRNGGGLLNGESSENKREYGETHDVIF